MGGGRINCGETVERLLEAFTLQALALKLASPANGLGLLTGTAFGRLFIRAPEFHFPKDAFTLHLLLQNLQGLVDIVITNGDLHVCLNLIIIKSGRDTELPCPKFAPCNTARLGCEGLISLIYSSIR